MWRINVEGGIILEKQYINPINVEWRVEKIYGINKRGGWTFFFKINKRDSTIIRESRVCMFLMFFCQLFNSYFPSNVNMNLINEKINTGVSRKIIF